MKFNPALLKAYLVGGTQDTNHDPHLFLAKVEQAMKAGITAFQYREKGSSRLNNEERLAMARQLRRLTAKYQIPLFIDDDEELALAVKADGVHVGQKDQRIEQVIRRGQGELMVGYSCNTLSQVQRANQLDAVDYLGSGPVFPTQSKADADPAIGIAGLEKIVEKSVHPVVAIGGITVQNCSSVLKTGVSGAAVISMVLDSDDINGAVKQLLTRP